MIETALHQLRYVLSVAFGLPFSPASLEALISATRDTIAEFGSVGQDGVELVNGLALDAKTQQEVISRRFRALMKRAARETTYYHDLFQQLGLNPKDARIEDIPITSKDAVRENPDSFVCRTARPYLRATTTGTTGKPTAIHFTQREMRVYAALQALAMLANGTATSEDIIQISVSARGLLGNVCLAVAAAHVGAMAYQTGVVEPEYALRILVEERHLTGKKTQTSQLYTYPSYLGYLTEYGLAHGYQPSDFGLEHISVGGEIITEGLKERAQALFGPVQWEEGYGITELWPLGGSCTADGLLNFDISHGLIEVINWETRAAAQPGEVGTIVGTPFGPFRETTLLLRYDTQDMVHVPLETTSGHQTTSNILGKEKLSVRHAQGWTYPREVMEALESLKCVPLPAQFGFWAVQDGVGVEVVTRAQTIAVRQQVEDSLEETGVPLRELHLLQSPHERHYPYPLRGDLREYTFGGPIPRIPV
jgi:phenylacetate-CoA ligase